MDDSQGNSRLNKGTPILLRLRGSKKTTDSSEATQAIRALISNLRRPALPCVPPMVSNNRVEIRTRQFNGWPVYTVSPRGITTSRRALYTHGGAWVYQITFSDWKLIADLAVMTATEFTVPIYPITPLGTATTVTPIITDLAAKLIREAGPEQVTLIGGSAGGNITLVAALKLRDQGVPACHRIILISPALDLAFDDPGIAAIAPYDPFLCQLGLQEATEAWRDGLSTRNPLVSPLDGNLTGLAPMLLFSGTHDILNVDARRLVRLARAANVPLEYHEVPNMPHSFPLLSIPEAEVAKSVMKAAMTSQEAV